MNLGLVLSGGGVKGAAHIGVLRALEEENINIKAVSGTSSGAIIAALVASGYTSREIYYIFKKYCRYITDYDRMIPFKVLGTIFTGKIKLKHLAKGNNIECIINNMCYQKGKVDMRDLDIPCVIPAVDIVSGEIVYFCSRKLRNGTTEYIDEPKYVYGGKISDVVRASTAFPAVFSPKKIHGHLLVDGGVRVNSPVSALKQYINNEKIAVVYFEKLDANTIPTNILDVANKSFDIMAHEVNKNEIELADYKIDIESQNVGLLDISKIDYMVNLGYRTMKQKIKANDLQ